jgi:hypothetical protein
MSVEKAYDATGKARVRTRLTRTGGSDKDSAAGGAVTGIAARRGSFITRIERRAFVRGWVRRVAAIIALLAGLSPALAEVHAIDPSGEVTNADFGYSSEDSVEYAPENDTPASGSLFGRVLKWAGLNIWVVMLRDQIQMETTDYLGLGATSFSLNGTLYLVNLTAAQRVADSCSSGSFSDQSRCQLEQDLLAAGWTNPNSTYGVSLGVEEMHSIRGSDFPRFFSVGMSAGELKIVSQLLQALAEIDSAFVADAPVQSELGTGLLGSGASPSEGLNDVPTPSIGPPAEPPVGEVPVSSPMPPVVTLVPEPILETSVPASIPELPVPVMLLVGAGALMLFIRKRALLG